MQHVRPILPGYREEFSRLVDYKRLNYKPRIVARELKEGRSHIFFHSSKIRICPLKVQWWIATLQRVARKIVFGGDPWLLVARRMLMRFTVFEVPIRVHLQGVID